MNFDKSKLKFYSLPNERCSCRDDTGDLTHISRKYKEFYNLIHSGKSGVESLSEMNIYRCCCRIKFLSIPIIPMIDRSTNRFFDDTKLSTTKQNTKILSPKVILPSFPLLYS